MIARDTMHQQQWLDVFEELGPEMATNAPGDYGNEPRSGPVPELQKAPPEVRAGAESTGPGAGAFNQIAKTVGGVVDKVTPG